MELFKRLPKVRPLARAKQQFIPEEVKHLHPAFAHDFATLEKHVMPLFRKLDNEAIRQQNSYRWMYVILIFGGALVTILGIVQLAVNIEALAIAGAIVAALLGFATLAQNSFHHHERYLHARLAAERLRSEYFRFLGHLEPYADEQERISLLEQRVTEIKIEEERHEPA
jgi:hypothetical protein